MKLLLENWREYLTEGDEEIKVLIPPTSLAAGRELIATTAMPGQDLEDEFDEDTLHMRQLLKSKLSELGLSVRALNCLKTAEVQTLGELVSFNKSDLLKFRNFGKKSLNELEALVDDKGLAFGLDISKYNLDNE